VIKMVNIVKKELYRQRENTHCDITLKVIL